MSAVKAAACILLASVFSNSAQAAVTGTVSGQISNLRIEGMAGFIEMSQSFGAACGTRIWVDMNTELGRAVYATAMMAFATKSTASLRADNEGARVFNECRLYDIVVSP